MSKRALKVLVTGGGGFIGSHLVDRLVSEGREVTVLDLWEPQVHGSHGKSGRPYRNPAARYLAGDVRRPADVRRAVASVDVVYHLAAQVGVGQSMYDLRRYTDHNVNGTAVLWEGILAQRRRVRRVVVASSMSLYGEGAAACRACGPVAAGERKPSDAAKGRWEVPCPRCAKPLRALPTPEEKPLSPTSVYAVTKRDEEEISLSVGRAYGIPAVALRFFNVFGPRQSLRNPYTGVMAIFLSQILSGRRPTVYEDGLQTRDFIAAEEVARCCAWLAASDRLDGQAVNVGTGRALSVLRVAEDLLRLTGSRLQPEVLGAFRAGDIRHCYADIRRLSAAGFSPRAELDARLRALAAWSAKAGRADLTAKARAELAKRRLVSRGARA